MQAEDSSRRSLIAFGVFFAETAFVYVVSGIVTASTVGDWYQTLRKPTFNPPDWLFTPVWSVLFLMIALGGWMAWRAAAGRQRRAVVSSFGVQLGLNCLWSILFFGLQWIGAALVEIVVLWVSILWTIRVFWSIDRRAALLFVPYACWVAFAIVLNAAIWMLN